MGGGATSSYRGKSLVYLKLKPTRLSPAAIVASTEDCSRSVGHLVGDSLCIDLVRLVLPPAPEGFCGWPFIWYDTFLQRSTI